MTNTEFHVDAESFAEAYTAVKLCAGKDKHDVDTFGIVRLNCWTDIGLLIEATDQYSISQAWVPLNFGDDRPSSEPDAQFSVVDSANRVEGLLRHVAKEKGVITLRMVEREGGLPGIGHAYELEFCHADRETIRASLLGTVMGDLNRHFDSFDPTECGGVFSIADKTDVLSKMFRAVGPVKIETSAAMLRVTPLKDAGFDYRAVLSVQPHDE